MRLFSWLRPENTVIANEGPSPAEQKQQVMARLRNVQAGTLRFAARKLEQRSNTVQNLAITTILIEEANDFRTLADTLSPEGNNVRV